MIFRRFFEAKLAQSSYLIGCSVSREAIVVDPNRAVDQYLQAAVQDGLRIAHVTETHIHADFVSGARELAHRAGAQLYLSGAGDAKWGYRYPDGVGATLLKDGSTIPVGRVMLQARHVPGHTPEHLAFLVTDGAKAAEPMGALTGDFIFVGDVGRPDLLERAVQAQGTMEQSAGHLFRSLQEFRRLPDYLQIWPGHGAGSACGKSLSAVPQSTLGYEKRFNWAFGVAEEQEFVRAVLAGQPEPPRYFAEMKRMNQSGPPLLGELQHPVHLPLTALIEALAQGHPVVDTREAVRFREGAIPGTINLPAGRTFTTWAGSLLPYDRDLYLLIDEGRTDIMELGRDLAGIGLDRVSGYFGLEAVEAWSKRHGELQRIPSITLAELQSRLNRDELVVLDVRDPGEWKAGHIPGSRNIPVARLEQQLGDLPRRGTLVVHCQTGPRAALAASLLRARGFGDVQLFSSGFAEWRGAAQPVQTG
ncbi:MAG TPA: rhodanese-like domain-containing protein [Gemmatimonadales bacterium]